MTDLAKLRKGKGAPPAADDAPDVIAQNGRDDEKGRRAEALFRKALQALSLIHISEPTRPY